MRRNLIIVLLAAIVAVLAFNQYNNDIPLLPFWDKHCPRQGSGHARCVITVNQGEALVYLMRNNGSIAVWGDKGKMSRDNPMGGIDYVAEGTYEVDWEDADWAIVPLEWARELANSPVGQPDF